MMLILLIEDNDFDADDFEIKWQASEQPPAIFERAYLLIQGIEKMTRKSYNVVILDTGVSDIGTPSEAITRLRSINPQIRLIVLSPGHHENVVKGAIAKDKSATLVQKDSGIQEFETSLGGLIRKGARDLGKIETEIQAIWRELGGTKDETERRFEREKREVDDRFNRDEGQLSQQIKDLRQAIQRSQDSVTLATEDLPEVKHRLNWAIARLENLEKDMASLHGVRQVQGGVRAIGQVFKERWKEIFALFLGLGSVTAINRDWIVELIQALFDL
jgi:DNA-binding NarL/FixJ family response regulator